MAKQVQRRRGTTAENDAFTGAEGEVTVDTTTNDLRVHDGSTEGGHAAGTVAAAGAVAAHNAAGDAHGARLPPTPVGQANGRILTVASDALVYADAAGGGVWEELARVTTVSTVSSVLFDGLGAFEMFRLHGYNLRAATGANTLRWAHLWLNGDTTAANYRTFTSFATNGVVANSELVDASTGLFVGNYPDSYASEAHGGFFEAIVSNTPDRGIIYRSEAVAHSADTPRWRHQLGYGGWTTPATITSIEVVARVNNFAAGSVFILEGLSNV